MSDRIALGRGCRQRGARSRARCRREAGATMAFKVGGRAVWASNRRRLKMAQEQLRPRCSRRGRRGQSSSIQYPEGMNRTRWATVLARTVGGRGVSRDAPPSSAWAGRDVPPSRRCTTDGPATGPGAAQMERTHARAQNRARSRSRNRARRRAQSNGRSAQPENSIALNDGPVPVAPKGPRCMSWADDAGCEGATHESGPSTP